MFGLLTTLALAATAVFQAQALPANCDRSMTVVKGDTCDTISAQYNASTYQVAAANIGVIGPQCHYIYPDEVICLGLTGLDCKTTYVVQPEDTCLGIAKAYNIPETTLHANNPNVHQPCNNLYHGEVLCVSSTIYPYPPQ